MSLNENRINSSFHSFLSGNTPSAELGRHESEFKLAVREYVLANQMDVDYQTFSFSSQKDLTEILDFLSNTADESKSTPEYRQAVIKLIETAQSLQNPTFKSSVLNFVETLPN